VTALACLSVPGCRVPLNLLESLSFAPGELAEALPDLRARTGASQICVLSTCERTEVYACWPDEADPAGLARALAAYRALPSGVVQDAAIQLTGTDAVRHLLRVTAGLESFVLGERDVAGQVRQAADSSRVAGTGGLELDRLTATAIHASRRVHGSTTFGEGGRSVAGAAVHRAAAGNGGTLAGRRVLVVGAGHVATEVAEVATRLGATVTVCNRTRRHAERLARAGATVVDLTLLTDALAEADVAIFGTAAPHRLLDADQLARTRDREDRELLLMDLCIPRNVDPDVRRLSGIRLVDLADLRTTGIAAAESVARDVRRAEEIVDEELERYLRWLSGRSVADSVRRMRDDLDARAQVEAQQAARGVPDELRPLVEDGVRRAVRRLAHGPTRRLLEAAEAGDDRLVDALATIFAP
jgi:glutamyl-tRNA reductase